LDLSSLYYIPVVELISLETINSLQGLGGNKVLYLSCCERVEDFSAARNISKVCIAVNANIVNRLGLEGVEDLSVYSCSDFPRH
jgi:hypothetical protein